MRTQIRQLVLAGALGIGVIGSGAALLGVGTVAGAALLRPTNLEAKAQNSCAAYSADGWELLAGQYTQDGGVLCAAR